MATQTDALAMVYARSLFELGEAAGGQAKIVELTDELEQIGELARSDRAFGELLASPIIDRHAREKTISRIFGDRVTDLMLRFLLVLNAKRRLNHLQAIAAAYDQLVQEAFGRVEVDVYTAAPLGEEQRRSIAQRIQSALGKEPVLHAYTDPSMIGGIQLRIGDQLIDGSVAAQLRRMRQNILASGSAAVRERMNRIIEEGG